jgi:hypothetical protein
MTKPLYLVECSYGRLGNAFRETDRDSNSLQGILDLIRSGEIKPIKILEVDEEMGRVEDITEEVMAKVDTEDRVPFTGQDKIDWDHDRARALVMAE